MSFRRAPGREGLELGLNVDVGLAVKPRRTEVRELRLGRSSRVMRGHTRYAGSKGKEVLMWSEDESDDGSLTIPWLV